MLQDFLNPSALHRSHRQTMRLVSLLLIFLAIFQLLVWLIPVPEVFHGLASYLPLHTLFETVAIVISILVFAVGWNSQSRRNLSGNIVLLACVFFAVAWLDFSHTLSYKGMPHFVTENDPEKAIDFWLAARFLAALGLLYVAIRPWRPFASANTRFALMGAGVTVTVFVNWLVLFHQQDIPHTFIPGHGLTSFKVGLEYLLIFCNLLTAALLWRRMLQPQTFNAALLFGAVCVMAMSELFFTLYASVTDIFNIMGHAYKVISYLLIYRAIVVESIETPYFKLEQMQKRVLDSELRYKTLIEDAADGLFVFNMEGRFVEVNQQACDSLGYSREELLQLGIADLSPEFDLASRRPQWDNFEIGSKYRMNSIHHRKDGSTFPVDIHLSVMQINNEKLIMALVSDITERKQAALALKASEQNLKQAQAIANLGSWRYDLATSRLSWSEELYRIYGVSPASFTPSFDSFIQLIHPDDQPVMQTWIGNCAAGRKPGVLEFRCLWPDGTTHYVEGQGELILDEEGKPDYLSGIGQDITEHKRATAEIEFLAFHDSLTRLPNRMLLQDRLQHALISCERNSLSGALLFIDLDNFKSLNDTLGHDIGDLLLQEVAQRLEQCMRDADTVGRLGGDEFVVMLEGLCEDSAEAAKQTKVVGEKILAALNQPYLLAAHEYHCSCSIGVTLFDKQQKKSDDLFKQADIAMYQAKKSGRNALRFFDPQMQDSINKRSALESELHKALEKDQFHLYYQLQVDSTGKPLGAEALIRWIHPERGLVSPMQFIPIAEDTGLILPIGMWVLEQACAQLKLWQHNAPTLHLTLAVNVSAKQFHQENFVELVKTTVQHYAINPSRLKLELTESLLLGNIEETINTMNLLSTIGIQLSLDDFGTGYSSLQYLKRLPLNQLKIDQSFVRDIVTDSSDKEIVRTIIAMAEIMNMDVIAEGVETDEQRQLLLNNGCTQYQGYLFGKPVPIAQFEASLQQH